MGGEEGEGVEGEERGVSLPLGVYPDAGGKKLEGGNKRRGKGGGEGEREEGESEGRGKGERGRGKGEEEEEEEEEQEVNLI